jgi:hypothetical protein
LQRAANVVAPGDVVTVLPGHYAGFDLTTSGTADARITFAAQGAGTSGGAAAADGAAGAGATSGGSSAGGSSAGGSSAGGAAASPSGAGGAVVIDTPNSVTPDGINLEGASFVTISGFDVVGMPRAGIRAVTDQGARILNNTVDQNQKWGILTGFSNDLLIQKNIASNSIEQHGIYVGNSAAGAVIDGNICFGNAQCGIHMNGDASMGGSGVITHALVENNIIHDNGAKGGSGINGDGVRDSTIENNLLYDNEAGGVALYRTDGSAGPKNDLIANNTIAMAADGRWAINVRDGASGVAIVNNLLLSKHSYHGGISVAGDSFTGLHSDHNGGVDRYSDDAGDTVMTLADWRTATGQDKHSFVASAGDLFVDPNHGDYHLAKDSPAIDAGEPVKGLDRDRDGNARPRGNGYDAGAYESKDAATAKGESRRGPGAGPMRWRQILEGATLLAGAGAAIVAWQARRKRELWWLASYVLQSRRRRAVRRRLHGREPAHVLLCIADHYEPQVGNPPAHVAMSRVNAWREKYPALFGEFRDSDGFAPRHSFFYPLEQYDPAEMDGIADLCRQGFGEVEVHLHHDHDNAKSLRRRLLAYARMLESRHGMLGRRKGDGKLVGQRDGHYGGQRDGQSEPQHDGHRDGPPDRQRDGQLGGHREGQSDAGPVYGFIHGNWALDNSRPDGRWCGVNNELDVLRETGCYCDFTLPSYPSACQTRKINSIYYAVDDPAKPKSHDTGWDVGGAAAARRFGLRDAPRNGASSRGGGAASYPAGTDDSASGVGTSAGKIAPAGLAVDAALREALMLIQGPLTLDWRRRKFGVLPRVENACIQGNQVPTMSRLRSWLSAGVGVANRPDWFFVKLHTHGAPEANQAVLLGEAMVKFHAGLAARAAADRRFHFHYVTARQMYNLAKAAEAGWTGSVAEARDFEVVWNGARREASATRDAGHSDRASTGAESGVKRGGERPGGLDVPVDARASGFR